MRRAMKAIGCVGVLLALGVAGCSPSSESASNPDPSPGLTKTDAGTMRVELAVTDKSVALVSARRLAKAAAGSTKTQGQGSAAGPGLTTTGTGAGDSHLEGGKSLRFEFRDAKGAVVKSGQVADPRVAYAEFDEKGQADARSYKAPVGVVTFDVPAVDGKATVFEGDSGSPVGDAPVPAPAPDDGTTPPPATSSSGAAGAPAAPGGSSNGVAGDAVKIVDHGSSGVFKILILAEGYTQSELMKFRTDAAAMTERLRQVKGYTEHWNQFSVWVQDVTSAASGIDDPAMMTSKTTAFEVTFGNDMGRPRRCVLPAQNVEATSLAKMTALRSAIGADAVVILANTDEYGGCAQPTNSMVTVTTNALAARILAHELAHTVFKLADEYDGGGVTCDPSRWTSGGINVGSNLMSLPWQDMIDASAVPTPAAEQATKVGAVEGAGYCTMGVYRPQSTCLMRTLESDFCKVCLRQLDQKVSAKAAEAAPAPECGNGKKDGQEECDGQDFGESTCESATGIPSNAGSLKCNADCKIDASGCGAMGCAHDVCSDGEPLAASCSSCTQKVCEADPYCCGGEWDFQCVSLVNEKCGMNCP